jgi:hypothetical protein
LRLAAPSSAEAVVFAFVLRAGFRSEELVSISVMHASIFSPGSDPGRRGNCARCPTFRAV